MTDNAKLRFDQQQAGQRDQLSGTQSERPSALPDDTGRAAEAESQMRKALGLLGEAPRHRPDAERSDQSGRGPDRFNGGLHRRRFVQDGDVPVTVMRRDPGQHETSAHRSAAAATPPTTSRLQRIEAALAGEVAARERAERALLESQAAARDLQTKIGHAELAKNEAVDALQREREAAALLRGEIDGLDAQLRGAVARAETAEREANEHQAALADERQARKSLETRLRAAEAARDAAEQSARKPADDPRPRARKALPTPRPSVDEPAATPPRRGRPPAGVMAQPEPEPVKWWLNPKPTAKRR